MDLTLFLTSKKVNNNSPNFTPEDKMCSLRISDNENGSIVISCSASPWLNIDHAAADRAFADGFLECYHYFLLPLYFQLHSLLLNLTRHHLAHSHEYSHPAQTSRMYATRNGEGDNNFLQRHAQLELLQSILNKNRIKSF